MVTSDGRKARDRSNFDSLLASWERHLRAEGKSPTTFSNYLVGARQFAAFLEGEGVHVLDADRGLVETWLAGLHGTMRPATVKTRYLAVRLFFDWLVDEEEVERSPFGSRLSRRIKPPEVPESPKDVVPVAKLAELFKRLDKERRWRDAVIVAVLYDTGMRASELADCLAEDVDLKEGTIFIVRSKGKRVRRVGISPATCRYIDRYWRRKRLDERYLVNGLKGKMTRDGISGVVEKCFREVGTPGIISAHDLRHTSATHQVLHGEVTESGLMATFGWKSAEMARHYTEQGRVAAALAEHRKSSPMSRLLGGKGLT